MKIRNKKLLIIYIVVIFPIMIACISLIISGTVCLSLSGFAVDSSDKLFIGKDSKIEVYEKGVMIDTIRPMTSRGYAFTIQQDDTILLSTASMVYTLDLQGNIINKEQDIGTKTFNKIQKSKKAFSTKNGNEYLLKNKFGRTEIICINSGSEETLYKMPILDYIVKILMIIIFISIFICVPTIIFKSRKSAKKSEWQAEQMKMVIST